MSGSYIIDGCRLPVGSFGGSLANARPDDMLAHVIKHLVAEYPQIPAERYADVIAGCANQAGEDNRNIARMSSLLAGLPFTVPGETVNRLCASGMSAVINAHRSILAGDGDVILAGGVENMSRGPLVVSKSSTPFGRDHQMYDSSFGWRFINPQMEKMYGVDSMGMTAENVAEKYNISGSEQNDYALASQMKAAESQRNGRLAKEIIPIEVRKSRKETISFEADEFIKSDSTLEKLTKLKPAFKEGGTVTAGNASGLNDGAACLLVASQHAVDQYELEPLARIISSGRSGVEPRIMGIGPVSASNIALKKAGLSIDDIGIIEMNEAFAVQVLACLKELGISMSDKRLNPNGGSIAIGHPLGMSGSRILLSAALELRLTGQKYALVTMCVGLGQGYAVVLENCADN